MISLRDTAENKNILQRLEQLRGDASPRWGKMNPAQMLVHCQRPLLVAAGKLPLKRGLLGRLFGRMAKKKFITSDAPFNQNSPTDPRFLDSDAQDFERERDELVGLVQAFAGVGATTRDPHPFFGPLTPEEWDRLMWKHLDHHLRQFGV